MAYPDRISDTLAAGTLEISGPCSSSDGQLAQSGFAPACYPEPAEVVSGWPCSRDTADARPADWDYIPAPDASDLVWTVADSRARNSSAEVLGAPASSDSGLGDWVCWAEADINQMSWALDVDPQEATHSCTARQGGGYCE